MVSVLEKGKPKGTSPARYGKPNRSLKLGKFLYHTRSYM